MELLPLEMGCESGITCWRRLRIDSRRASGDALHHELLHWLRAANRINWSRACMAAHCWLPKGGATRLSRTRLLETSLAPSATFSDRNGIPLAFVLAGANTQESMPFEAARQHLVDRKAGRGWRRLDRLHADKAYDHRRRRQAYRRCRIAPRIARRGIETSQTLSRHRWVIERTFARINRNCRLVTRCERRGNIHHAFIASPAHSSASASCRGGLKGALVSTWPSGGLAKGIDYRVLKC